MPKTYQNCCQRLKKHNKYDISHVVLHTNCAHNAFMNHLEQLWNCAAADSNWILKKYYERRSLVSTLQTFVGKKVEPCMFKLKFCLILGYPIQSEWDAKKIVVHTSMKAHLH